MAETSSMCSVMRFSCLLVLATGLGWVAAENVRAEPIRAFVSIPPQKIAVERIGGDLVQVGVLLGKGQSPHSFEPTPRQMSAVTSADVYFAIGVPFEKQVVGKLRDAAPNLNIIETQPGEGAAADAGGHAECDGHDHDHAEHADDGDHGHHHDGEDPHSWLDPMEMKAQSAIICAALTKLMPDKEETLKANLAVWSAELDRVDGELREKLAPFKGRSFYVFHPAFGHFAEAYGLKQIAIENQGKQPTARELVALIKQAQDEGVKMVFVQPQFDARHAETIARQINAKVLKMDPLAEDYVGNLREMAEKIESALAK